MENPVTPPAAPRPGLATQISTVPVLPDRLDRPTPRYTSYPTAPHFHAGIDADRYGAWLRSIPDRSRLSLYVHIPFCDRLCCFCGCTTKQTNKYKPVEQYLESLFQEIAAVGKRVPETATVTDLHLGGGSPTLLTPESFAALGDTLRRHFAIADSAEISIEMDPNDLDEARCDAMAAFGVTRASLGVQDFDPVVQRAINRPQTFEQTRAAVEAMRARGVRSVNLDMLYGLPHQTLETIDDTVARIVSLQPDRIALFGYAHVPWIKKHQSMIDEAALPGALERFDQANHAAQRLLAEGYDRVGMDHFARPHDALARAARGGRLYRNFQGYTTDDADALIGLGASSIGRLPQGYVQNAPSTHDYARRLAGPDGLATVRGVALSDEDRMRGWIIERLMCDFRFDTAELHRRFGVRAARAVEEAQEICTCDPDGLLVQRDGGYAVTEAGRPYVRTIAAGFDTYLSRGVARHSASV